ncbi:hypothetical protein OSSY52_15550 [Tepiditoga spiralis]|uniref:HTH tetR-type domain-containing protein n=1 Tax=Tepiditoga spiralis TaxID=2108365 RepID=A0A7G1G867_9BACT|nr:TetR/AcrR family transcriptional regulator [Tepiditoga spiralis]BBE31414.1 hypothetical protein OSSY52_15550 [Tepiditoga spiralis]
MKKIYQKKSTKKKLEKLIEYSKIELVEQGFSKFNLNKVINSSGISKATFYKNYKSKQNFILIVIKNIIDEFVTPLKEFLNAINDIEEIINLIENYNLDPQKLLKEYPIKDLFYNHETAKFINEYYYKTFENIILEKIIISQKNGTIRNDVDPKFIFEFLTSIIKGIGHMIEDDDFKKIVDNYKKLILSALKTNEVEK